jgi:predicted AlkP superfamily pyrophosphatase or phosphodiesterase
VIIVSIDGLKPETYTKAGPASVPAIRKIAAEGVYAEGVVGVFPTATFPSHTTLITGVLPAVHGIYVNRVLDPQDLSNQAWHWYAKEITVPTLPGAVRGRGLTAAAVSWPVSVDMEADYLFPEYRRPLHPEALLLFRALSRPRSLFDDVEIDQGKPIALPLDDRQRVAIATHILRVHRPHLLLLYLSEVDEAQHSYGPGSPEALASIAGVDRKIADLLNAIGAAGLRETTDVLVVSDHGFVPIRRQLQLNALFERERLLTTDGRGRLTAWDAYAQTSGGAAFVFLRNPEDLALQERVGATLARVAADEANGVARVLSRADLTRMGADPRASFAVLMRLGFYTGNATNALLGPPSSKGGHGFEPDQPEMHASFVAAGPHVPRAGDLGEIRMTQIAPTVAAWFGVGLSPKADQPLELKK